MRRYREEPYGSEYDWLADRLAMGLGSYVSTLVIRFCRDKKERKVMKKYEKIWKI